VAGFAGIAYLSQHFELQKFLRVEQVLAYSNKISAQVAATLYEVCQIDHLLKRKTDQLSGGEKQRIAICRLLISSPGLLLLDEPFSHLDMVHKNTLKTVIHDIGARLKITCVLVSHDPQDSLSWADKVLVMKEGRIMQQGTPESVYREPANEYVGGLFGNYNLIAPQMFRSLSVIPVMRRYAAKAGNRSVFIRPEDFKLVYKKDTAVRGKITRIGFLGQGYEIEVTCSKCVLLVKTDRRHLGLGDTVHLSLNGGNGWLL
jgi:iron(III) transport system ATP-binding protein